MPPAVSRGLLRWLPVLCCLGVVGLHLDVWASRVPYPFDLEWMEGGMLAHAWRLQRGLPLYVRPNPDFVPYVYPPGYASLLAAVGSVVGLSPALGRVVSLLGLALGMAGAAFFVTRSTGSRRAGVFGAVAFLGTYQWAGTFYDLVRPDTWFLALVTWSMALAVERGRRTAVSSGLVLAAAFTMKHNAAMWGLPLALVITWRDGWRRALWFGLAAAVPAGALALRLEVASDGLFTTYLLRVPASHPRLDGRWWPGLQYEVGNALPLPLALVTAYVWRRAVDQPLARALSVWGPGVAGTLAAWEGTYKPPPADTGFLNVAAMFGYFATGAVPVAVLLWAIGGRRRGDLVAPVLFGGITVVVVGLMRAHNGGFLNVVAPLYLAVALAAAWVVGELARAGHHAAVAALVALHCAWVAGEFERDAIRPRPADLVAGEQFVEACRTVDGPVLSPFAAWLPTYAGKPPSLHFMGVWDLNYPGNPLQQDLQVIVDSVHGHYWDLALQSNIPFGFGLAESYAPADDPSPDQAGKPMTPRTGWQARPTKVLRPR